MSFTAAGAPSHRAYPPPHSAPGKQLPRSPLPPRPCCPPPLAATSCNCQQIRWASLMVVDRTMTWWRQELLVVMISCFILYPAWAQVTAAQIRTAAPHGAAPGLCVLCLQRSSGERRGAVATSQTTLPGAAPPRPARFLPHTPTQARTQQTPPSFPAVCPVHLRLLHAGRRHGPLPRAAAGQQHPRLLVSEHTAP